MRKYFLILCISAGFLLMPVMAAANGAVETGAEHEQAAGGMDDLCGVLAKFGQRVADVWTIGKYDLYAPVYTWHNRFMYSSGKTRKYNEIPGGIGFGKSNIDEDGDEHTLYAVGFSDSNYKFEPIVGYAFFKNLYLDEARDVSVGLGYSLNITGRHEYYYAPLPLPLPVASFRYKQFSLLASYVPGGQNDGNVLFVMAKWTFD